LKATSASLEKKKAEKRGLKGNIEEGLPGRRRFGSETIKTKET